MIAPVVRSLSRVIISGFDGCAAIVWHAGLLFFIDWRIHEPRPLRRNILELIRRTSALLPPDVESLIRHFEAPRGVAYQ
jgi:hypothetical protein